MSLFQKASKESAKLRLAISGPPGAGKTRSALEIGRHFGKIALADTEHRSASKYAGLVDFDTCIVQKPYDPRKIEPLIKDAADAGFDLLIIDSMTHFWNSEGGFLALVDEVAKKAAAKFSGGRADTFGAWKTVDPIYQKMVDSILTAPIHVIVTLRSKMEHVIEEENGKKKVKKMGMAPEMRDNFAYVLDIEGSMNMEHDLIIGKTRCDELDGKVFNKPGAEVAEIIKRWLA